MRDGDGDTAELQRLLLAAPARPELFDRVLPAVAALAEQGDDETLTRLAPCFGAAATALDAHTAPDRRTVRFSLHTDGRVARVTAAAVDSFALEPGADFSALLGAQGQCAFARIARGTVQECLVSATILPDQRPTLVALHRTGPSTIAARALVSVWRAEIEGALAQDFALSHTETEITRALFEGLTPKAIACWRGRSIETIRSQIRTLYAKMGVRNALDLAHLIYALSVALPMAEGGSGGRTPGLRRLIEGPRGAIDVVLRGPRSGRALLFLHGCLGGRTFMAEAERHLAARFVIAPARAGHGRTPATGAVAPGEAPEAAAAEALAVLDHLEIAQTDVLAYDTGAAAALALARLAPGRVGRIVLVAALPAMARTRDVLALPRQQRVFPLLVRTSRSACLALARLGGERLLAGGPHRFAQTVFAGAAADLAACENADVAECFWRGHAWHTCQGSEGFVGEAAMTAQAWDARVVRAAVDLVYVHGDADASAPLQRVEALRALSGGRLAVVAGAGHALLHASPSAWLGLLDTAQ
ncbi:MAG: alpha/beta fold hydrolase [Pseudomonadota bacterium]